MTTDPMLDYYRQFGGFLDKLTDSMLQPRPAAPRKIVTSFWAKPIPLRQFDWCAYVDGNEEGPCGYGSTEAEAIAELEAMLEDEAA